MSNNDRLQAHTDPKTGKRYFTTTDTSGKHTLTVDADNAHLLRDTTWRVVPVRAGSSKLHARACSSAPRIKKGQLLHRLALRKVASHRRVRSLDGNWLNASKANLQSVSLSDVIILGKTQPAGKWVGVQFTPQLPKWLHSQCHYHARIKIEGNRRLHLGSFKTAEEAAACYDNAARRLYGHRCVTNKSLG